MQKSNYTQYIFDLDLDLDFDYAYSFNQYKSILGHFSLFTVFPRQNANIILFSTGNILII